MYNRPSCSSRCRAFVKATKTLIRVIGDSTRMGPAGSGLVGTMLFCVFLSHAFSSCRPDPEKSREELIREYGCFSDSVESLSSIPFRRLPDVMERWTRLEDDIISSLAGDTTANDENLITFSTLSVYGNRILSKVRSSIDSRKRSFTEVSDFQREMASRMYPSANSYVKEANDFYDQSLCQSAEMVSPEDELMQYLGFLDEAEDWQLSDFEEVKDFLYHEDILYRAYMDNMLAHSYRDSYRIISQTEVFSDRLSDYAAAHPSESERLLAYMTVRTIRRQLVCARKGLSCIFNDEVATLDQATSAATCFTVVFVHFNPLLLSYRTERQEAEVDTICREASRAFQRLEEKGLVVIAHPDSLPNRILKDYIDYLLYN